MLLKDELRMLFAAPRNSFPPCTPSAPRPAVSPSCPENPLLRDRAGALLTRAAFRSEMFSPLETLCNGSILDPLKSIVRA